MAQGTNRAKVDANQTGIVDGLRAVGCFVQSLAGIGNGCPDILVGADGRWCLMEIKDGKKPPSQRKLTEDEIKWHKKANCFAPVWVVYNLDGALWVCGKTGAAPDLKPIRLVE